MRCDDDVACWDPALVTATVHVDLGAETVSVHRQGLPRTATLRRLVFRCNASIWVGACDRALLLLRFGASLRRSELVALDTQDVTETAEGLGVGMRRSKTDPQTQGDDVGLPVTTAPMYIRCEHCSAGALSGT
jgi:hypothetical protein